MIFKSKKLLTLPEQIAEHIKEAIAGGQTKPGDKLPSEDELAEYFQVSRPTIRDAIKNLTASKLIITRPGAKGGHFVSTISPESIVSDFSDYISLSLGLKGITLEEVIEMRKMVEIESCSLAAERRTDEDLRKMAELLPTLETPLSDTLYYERDFEFHRIVAKATRNRLILVTIDAINIALKPLFSSVDCPLELKMELNKELQSIYAAIEKRDSKKAAQIMADHLKHFEGHFSKVRSDLWTEAK